MGMTDFLGIFDETQSIDEFVDFLDHLVMLSDDFFTF
jgi:hypothetical protein